MRMNIIAVQEISYKNARKHEKSKNAYLKHSVSPIVRAKHEYLCLIHHFGGLNDSLDMKSATDTFLSRAQA